jgi:hypothetical protein
MHMHTIHYGIIQYCSENEWVHMVFKTNFGESSTKMDFVHWCFEEGWINISELQFVRSTPTADKQWNRILRVLSDKKVNSNIVLMQYKKAHENIEGGDVKHG